MIRRELSLALTVEEALELVVADVNVERRYALDDEESGLGLRYVEAAIVDAGGPIGAISVSGPTTRVNAGSVPFIGAAMVEAARQISTATGFSGDTYHL
jgi:DNA-binding IclR family transcriptional regulator